MDIKDNFVRLYVKRFVIPRALILDVPGFVNFKISGKTSIFARQLLVPESFFINLEKVIVEKFGEKGKSIFYSVGKKFGYSFAQLGRFENISDHPGDAVKDWIVIASKFVEGTYASEISQVIDVKNKTVDYTLKNFVICRKLGYDFFLATGGAAGVIAWLFQDKNIEGYYYDNKFLEDGNICKVKCAPYKILKNSFSDNVFSETNLDDLTHDPMNYLKFNEEKPLRYNKSFSNYLDAKIFSYENGIVSYNYNKERFFLMEVSGMYLLEKELKANGLSNILFDIAYDAGKNLFSEFGQKDEKSCLELMAALGWGEILVLPPVNNKLNIVVNYFPWTKWYNEINFSMLSGFLSGMLSNIKGYKVRLENPIVDINNSYLAILYREI
jgi:predicted hydrocarbon binding protein